MTPRSRKGEAPKIPRQSRSRATVAAIVEAATRILAEQGYERTHVNTVAERAGVSVGSLYQYFPTKESLVSAVAAQLSADMLRAFSNDIGELASQPMPLAIRGIVARTMTAFEMNPRLRRVIRTEVPSAVRAFETPDFDQMLEDALVQYLEIQRDNIRPANARLAVWILTTSVEAIAAELTGDTTIDRDILIDETAALVSRYLLREP